MKLNKTITIFLLGIALFVAGSAFWIFLKRGSNSQTVDQVDVPVNMENLLAAYSNSLNSGKINDQSVFSDEMLLLIPERRNFYAEYFKKGLYLELEELESQFVTDQMTVSNNGDVIHVDVMEFITMRGHPLIQKAEEYPLVAAVDWAIGVTNDENVQEVLHQYRLSTIDGVNDSILNGVEINFRVHHKIEIAKQDGKLQIVQDEFTDKEIDNGDGYDNVTWVDGKPQRQYPDFTSMLEYSIYNTPIESLGEILLDDYTRVHGDEVSGTPTQTLVPFALPAFTPPNDWQEYSSEYTYAADSSPDGSSGFLKYGLRYPAGWYLYPGSTISMPGLEGETYLMNFERVSTDMWYQTQSAGTVKIAIYALPCRSFPNECRTDVPELQPGVFVFREITETNDRNSIWTVWRVAINARGFRLGLSGYMPGKPEDNTDLIETLDQILSTVKILDGGITLPTGAPLPTP